MQIQAMILMILGLITTSAFAIDVGIKGHSKGDVIAVKTDDQIAAWCDFNKQILNTSFNTLCIYNGSNQSLALNKKLGKSTK